MKKFLAATAAIALLVGAAGGAASAQPGRGNDHNQQNDNRNNQANGYRQHSDWRKGKRLSRSDWSRGQRVDYRTRHLQRPPRGYEWREVDGNLILGAIATGLIFSIIANH